MTTSKIPPKIVREDAPNSLVSRLRPVEYPTYYPILREEESFERRFPIQELSVEQLLLQKAIGICERHRLSFTGLSAIQRKFVTHYRCNQCGLLPLYHINLSHPKRVRCRECGQLIGFTRKGKYGKLRKEIAIELCKEISRDV